MTSNKAYLAVMSYLDKLVQPCYMLSTQIKPLVWYSQCFSCICFSQCNSAWKATSTYEEYVDRQQASKQPMAIAQEMSGYYLGERQGRG